MELLRRLRKGQRPGWRRLYPGAYVSLAAACRWALRRVVALQYMLERLPILMPEEFGELDPDLEAYGRELGIEPGSGEVLSRLRELAEKVLQGLPGPVGFLPCGVTPVKKADFRPCQHFMSTPGRSPP